MILPPPGFKQPIESDDERWEREERLQEVRNHVWRAFQASDKREPTLTDEWMLEALGIIPQKCNK